ncbi:hypothetical protein Droror1_Dr00025353 [Drosera rotundifolia]
MVCESWSWFFWKVFKKLFGLDQVAFVSAFSVCAELDVVARTNGCHLSTIFPNCIEAAGLDDLRIMAAQCLHLRKSLRQSSYNSRTSVSSIFMTFQGSLLSRVGAPVKRQLLGRKYLAKEVYKFTALHPVGSNKLWRIGYAIEERLKL